MFATIIIGDFRNSAPSFHGDGNQNHGLREESVPEHPQQVTPEHEQYEALCALAAGGLLEGPEFVDFQAHLKECGKCRADFEELSSLVTQELPQARAAFGRN